MANSKQKGARGEAQAKDFLKKHTGLPWERIPFSGALPYLKGDLYIPNRQMKYCVEVKFYSDNPLNHLLINGKPEIFNWWTQAVDQCSTELLPLLLFKWNRSKIYAMISGFPVECNDFIYVNQKDASILLAEDWITQDKPEFII